MWRLKLKQQQSRWLWVPLAPSRRTWKTTPTNSFNILTYISIFPGNINIHELQKITVLSTAHLLRRVLSVKQKPSLPPKVHGLDWDVERENHWQFHQQILYIIMIIIFKDLSRIIKSRGHQSILYPASRGFSLAWLLTFTKSFRWIVCRAGLLVWFRVVWDV